MDSPRPIKSIKRSRDQDAVSPSSSSWKDIASALLEFVDLEKMLICLDLDHTLWDESCFEHTSPPYVAVPGPEIHVKSVAYTSRRDRTKCQLSLYPEAYEVLSWCYEQGVPLSICSKSQVDSAAKGILMALDMWKFFRFPQIYNKRKTTHFKQLKECTDLDYNSFLFFDDDSTNVEMCAALGGVAEKVDPRRGLTKELFLRGLTSFVTRQLTTPARAPVSPLREQMPSSSSSSSSSSNVAATTGGGLITPVDAPVSAPIFAGLIPHRMSGISLDNYKFLIPLDVSPPVAQLGSPGAVSVVSAGESEDEEEFCRAHIKTKGEDADEEEDVGLDVDVDIAAGDEGQGAPLSRGADGVTGPDQLILSF